MEQDAVNVKAELKEMMRGAVHAYLEYAIDYAAAGLYEEASALLQFVVEDNEPGRIRWFIMHWDIFLHWQVTRLRPNDIM